MSIDCVTTRTIDALKWEALNWEALKWDTPVFCKDKEYLVESRRVETNGARAGLRKVKISLVDRERGKVFCAARIVLKQ